ncbi:MAG: [Fe-Fe] hydrogenase large subunit C-terminal domain-containing protein [Bacillota bacterium]
MELIRTRINDCENCYKCIRTCPVKAISFKDNQAQIIDDDCIFCGLCKNACPQDAKSVHSDMHFLKNWLLSGREVVVSIAPSFLSDFYKSDFNSMRTALKKLGIKEAYQTAEAATVVKKRYEEEISEQRSPLIISSACPTVNLLIQKHYPSLIPYLSNTPSPMHIHSKMIEERHPDALKVFIGPCLSKKYEARITKSMDAVISFIELKDWFHEKGVACEQKSHDNPTGKTNAFPVSGGIIRSFNTYETQYHYLSVDNIDACKQALSDIEEGIIDNAFIEMSACENSCTGGPLRNEKTKKPLKSIINIKQNTSEEDYPVHTLFKDSTMHYDRLFKKTALPSEQELKEILEKMGKDDPEKILNCGSCGYDTCKEKAIAVYQNKADLTMCLPYLKEKAESFSDNIVHNTPNGVTVFNTNLKIHTMNPAAKTLMGAQGIRENTLYIHELLDPDFYLNMIENKETKSHRTFFHPDQKCHIDETVVYDTSFQVFISIMRDITAEIRHKTQKEKTYKKTIAITDGVIDKQMRVVHEIASLLGETTAETKSALTDLKKVIDNE